MLIDYWKKFMISSTKTLLIQDKQKGNNETPLYTTIQKDKTIDVDKRIQDCGGIIDPLQDNVDNKQERARRVYHNSLDLEKCRKFLNYKMKLYVTTKHLLDEERRMILNYQCQCNIPADWDPDNNNICQDTVDANKAVQDLGPIEHHNKKSSK